MRPATLKLKKFCRSEEDQHTFVDLLQLSYKHFTKLY